ncbi:MAG: hypothetical protein ACK5KP_03195 [Paludibacteraceae bacterium]
MKILITLFSFFIGMVILSDTLQAQVTLGSNTAPNGNAILDLKNTADENASTKGLLLPRVMLTSTTAYAPLTAHVAAMVVYNTATAGDVTPGYYYNDGTKWMRIADTGIEPWYNVLTNKSATSNTQDIYQTGKVGIGTTTPNKKLEVNSGTTGETGLRFTQANSSSTKITNASGALGLNTSGDVVPIFRDETVFVGRVTLGATVPTGYNNLPLTPVYDPYSLYSTANKGWAVPNDQYIYEYTVTLTREDFTALLGANPFTRYRSNSANITPLPTTTGQSFGYSYTGVYSRNSTANVTNGYSNLGILLLNNAGTSVTLNGAAIENGYWTILIRRIGIIQP